MRINLKMTRRPLNHLNTNFNEEHGAAGARMMFVKCPHRSRQNFAKERLPERGLVAVVHGDPNTIYTYTYNRAPLSFREGNHARHLCCCLHPARVFPAHHIRSDGDHLPTQWPQSQQRRWGPAFGSHKEPRLPTFPVTSSAMTISMLSVKKGCQPKAAPASRGS